MTETTTAENTTGKRSCRLCGRPAGRAHFFDYEGTLRYAVDRPFLAFGGRPMYPSPYAKAAALMEIIVQGHPFENGNKRTGLAAGAALLRVLTGKVITVPKPEAIRVSKAVEAKKMDTADLARWFYACSYYK
jgi:death-on-curing protein